MGKILDLAAFSEETLDIRMDDGRVIHLRKPTQALAIAMLQLRHLNDDTPPEAALAMQNNVVQKIMNHNADGIVFSMESIATLTLPVKNAIVSGYAGFAQELVENPTTSSLQCQEKKETAKRSFLGMFMRRQNTRK